MNRLLPFLVLSCMLAGSASAGTVIITGGCSSLIHNSTTLLFSLSNSGNDTAFNLTATPFIYGATPSSYSYTINSLPPGANDTFAIGISNVTEVGAHVVRVETLYRQGVSYFTAVFPCLIDIFNTTRSQLALGIYASPLQNGNAFVKVVATNLGATNLRANISLMLPPEFNSTVTSQYLDLAPRESTNFTFQAFLLPSSTVGTYSSYGVAVSGTYSISNLSYASLEIFSLVPLSSSSQSSSNSLLSAAAIVGAVIIVAIVLYSFLRKKKKR